MLRIILISFALLCLTTVMIFGWRGQASTRPPIEPFDDMHEQPRYAPQRESRFFADGRMMRPPPAGTVAWGRDPRQSDTAFFHTNEDFYPVTDWPVPITRELLLRGKQQYDIFCLVCHGGTGEGDGITVEYGMIPPPTIHSDRVRDMPIGELFQIITDGRGLMGPYGHKINREDRWAIIAYMRALQRAYTATVEDVPEPHRSELERRP